MSTKPDTDTGWSKEWPTAKDSFHWMRWIDGRYRDLPVHVNGIQVMCLFDHSYQQRGNIEGLVEFLGPISPSDFEQLIRLRRIAAEVVIALDATVVDEPKSTNGLAFQQYENFDAQLKSLRDAANALREALAHKEEKS